MNLRLGTGQTLAIGSTTLSLTTAANFNAEGVNGIGYSRNIENNVEIEYNIWGKGFIRQQSFGERYKFQWEIFLSEQQLTILQALYSLQSRRLAQRTANPECVLTDNLLPLIEPTPASRTQSSTLVPTLVTQYVPGGFTAYYPVFNIYFTEAPKTEWFYSGLWKVRLEAEEVA